MDFLSPEYESFIAVYETGNTALAAKMLDKTRNAVARNIRTLEGRLKIGKLFYDVRPKGVQPTPAAIEHYETIIGHISQIEFSERNAGIFNNESAKVIRMAMPATVANFNLRNYMKEFSKDYPNVRFEFRKKNSFELLKDKKIDFVIGVDKVLKDQTFETIELFSDQMIFVATMNYLLENDIDNTITIEQFEKLRLIATENNLIELNKKTNLDMQAHILTEDAQQVYTLAEDGFGIGLYFKDALERFLFTDLVEVKVKGIELPTIKAVCAYNKNYLPKAAEAFIKGLEKHFASLSK